MSTTKLLETLLEIERSLGRADHTTLRNMVMDAEIQVLHLQKGTIEVLEELRDLRERRELQAPVNSWRAVAQALAKNEAEKDATRAMGPLAVAAMLATVTDRAS